MPALPQQTPAPELPHRAADPSGTLLRRAILHHEAGDLAEAEHLYRDLLDRQPDASEASHNLGILLLQRREPEAAMPFLKSAVDHNPHHLPFRIRYAEAQLEAGRFEQAGEILIDVARLGLRSGQIEALAARIDALSEGQALAGGNWMPDLHGSLYTHVLERLHRTLAPRTYLEIGVESGVTLALARCASIGIDPCFQFTDIELVRRIFAKPGVALYQMPSDDFFAAFNPTLILGAPIDFAFLDGMHRCEYLLRDFLNAERHCRPGSLVALHDCLPLDLSMTERDPGGKTLDPARRSMWTGDVWRTALFLKRHRPDLSMLVLDAAPTGLVLISNLDPHNTLLDGNFDACVAEMMSWSLVELTLSRYYEQLDVQPEISLRDARKLLIRLHGDGPGPPSPRASGSATTVRASIRTQERRSRGKRSKLRPADPRPPVRAPGPSSEETAALLALYQEARYPEAESLARSLCSRFPGHSFAWKALGAMLQKQGRFAEALEVKRRSAELAANDPEAQNNLGNAYIKLDRFDEAAACYRKALALRPDYAEAESGLGITLQKLGDLAEAEVHCRRSLALRPGFADASSNLGIILQEAGRLDEAEASYRDALRFDPGHADAWNNLGITLQKLDRLGDAEAAHRQALAIHPEHADALTNLAGCLQLQARLAEAEACYRRVLEIQPGHLKAHSNLLFCLSHDPVVTPEALFAEHLRAGERIEAPHRAGRQPHTNRRDPHRVLNIGFVSADLQVHATSHFTEPALTHLSRRSDLALHIYANHLVDDHVTGRFRAHLTNWSRVYGLSDDALAARIRGDGIDILIDLSGHTSGHRLPVFARKPAPVQIGWIGYLGTSGMKSMDYYLADSFYLPPGKFDRFFTETLLHLPVIAPFQPSNDAPPVNPLPALAKGHMTFASFSRMGKISPEVIALWSQLLHATPGSKMMLGGMSGEREFAILLARFIDCGIPSARIDCRLRTNMADYLKQHHQVDLCLDPFPFTGATTTGHALWMGVPTLTLLGETAPGRLGAAMLRHAGLADFVAYDPRDFIDKGVRWAKDYGSLAQLRASLRDRFQQSPLAQAEDFAQNLAAAFRRAWQLWCAQA